MVASSLRPKERRERRERGKVKVKVRSFPLSLSFTSLVLRSLSLCLLITLLPSSIQPTFAFLHLPSSPSSFSPYLNNLNNCIGSRSPNQNNACSSIIHQREEQKRKGRKRRSSSSSSSSSSTALYMIDNFFRLHETNRELDSQYGDLFLKNRYDEPHAFGTSVVSYSPEKEDSSEKSLTFTQAVEEAFHSAMNQLPACASIDFVSILIQEDEVSSEDAELKVRILEDVIPIFTSTSSTSNSKKIPIIGWLGEVGTLVGNKKKDNKRTDVDVNVDGETGEEIQVIGKGRAGVSIVVGSLPGVNITPFSLTNQELKQYQFDVEKDVEDDGEDEKKTFWSSLFQIDALDGKSEPPCFYLLGKPKSSRLTTIDNVLKSLEYSYPGSSKFGSLFHPDSNLYSFCSCDSSGNGGSIGGDTNSLTLVSSSSPSSTDNKEGEVQQEEKEEIVMGLCMNGDIRTMIYSSLPHGNEQQKQEEEKEERDSESQQSFEISLKNENIVLPPSFNPSTQNENKKKEEEEENILIKNIKSIPSDMNQNDYELFIKLSPPITKLPEGPDRWSGTAVRGNILTKLSIYRQDWKLNYLYDKVSLEISPSFLTLLQDCNNSLLFQRRSSASTAKVETEKEAEVEAEAEAAEDRMMAYSETLDTLRNEFIKEYNAQELGTSRFRASAALVFGDKGSNALFESNSNSSSGNGKEERKEAKIAKINIVEKLNSLFRMTNLNGLTGSWKQIAPLTPGISSGITDQNTMTVAFSCNARRKDVRNFRFNPQEKLYRILETERDIEAKGNDAPNESKSEEDNDDTKARKEEQQQREEQEQPQQLTEEEKHQFKGTKNTFENLFSPPKFDEHGDVLVERKASLGGSDVRVDNMAWGLKIDTAPPSSVMELIVWNKEREMELLREDAPLINLVKTVMIKQKQSEETKPLDIFDLIQSSFVYATNWFEFGRIRRGSPTSGLIVHPYKPQEITTAWKSQKNGHLPGVVVDVDQTFYGGSYENLREIRNIPVNRDVPIICDDLVLYPYQIYLARLFGADGITIRPHLTTSEDLTYMLKISKSLEMTPFLVVSSIAQLERSLTLLLPNNPAILVLDDTNFGNMGSLSDNSGIHPASVWLENYDLYGRMEELGLRRQDIILLVDGKHQINEEEKVKLQSMGIRGAIATERDMLSIVQGNWKKNAGARRREIHLDEDYDDNNNNDNSDNENVPQSKDYVAKEEEKQEEDGPSLPTPESLGSFNLGDLGNSGAGGGSIKIF